MELLLMNNSKNWSGQNLTSLTACYGLACTPNSSDQAARWKFSVGNNYYQSCQLIKIKTIHIMIQVVMHNGSVILINKVLIQYVLNFYYYNNRNKSS